MRIATGGLCLVGCAVWAIGGGALAADDLENGFVSPPASARPHTWWHWMNGNVSKEGITADLEAMARVGIGGAQIFNAAENIPHGPVQFNSPEWVGLVKHAAQEARRLGLELCIHNCAGWSSSGGPWVTPEQGMQEVVFSETQVRGPSRVEAALPLPPVRLNTYHDIAVLAFPTPSGERTRMADAHPSITSESGARADEVSDRKAATVTRLRSPTEQAPVWLDFRFDKPYLARMLSLVMPGSQWQKYSGRVEVSEDGQTFRTLTSFTWSFGDVRRFIPFTPVTAGHFRVVFEQAGAGSDGLGVAEADLWTRAGIDNLPGKTFAIRDGRYEPSDVSGLSADDVVPRDRVVDLTAALTPEGRVTWEAPAGSWTILRVGYTPNGRKNHPAPTEGTGLECDKLSKEAAQAYWDGSMGKLLAALGPLADKAPSGLNNVLIDSYEVGAQNWTRNFKAEFQKRRGYDLARFLPILAGRIIDSPEVTERFLWDFRRTIADLFAENYSGQFREMAHRAGLEYSVEPYGNCPSDDIQYGSYSDIPMGEFWPGSGESVNTGNAKLPASIAHVYGKKFVGAESFTASPEAGKWLKDPFSIKAQGDAVYCGGVNRIIYHRYAHQPWTQPTRYPGMTMGQWGTHFERTLTWWEQSKDWLLYQARCQYLLQEGVFVADACFYCGEDAPNSLRGSLPAGYDYDGCDTAALSLMSVKDGRIVLPSGMSYRMLVLPDGKTMSPGVLKTVGKLVDAGAVVVGPKPVRAPGLGGYPACDTEVGQLADAIWSKGVRTDAPIRVLTALGVKPDFACASKTSRLHFIHRVIGGADVYFVASARSVGDEAACTFRVSGKVPELWYPDTGVIARAPVYSEKDGCTTVPLRFDPSGSVFVVFRRLVSGDHVVSARVVAEEGGSKGLLPELKILKAEYGLLGDSPHCVDVTDKVTACVHDGELEVQADNTMAGKDPASNKVKALCVTYLYNGQKKEARVGENEMLTLPESVGRHTPLPVCELAADKDGTVTVSAWQAGFVKATTAAGRTVQVALPAPPPPFEVAGAWELSFPPNWGAPVRVTLDKLISWTDHPDTGVKYFSGTATYRKAFVWEAEKRPGVRYVLDLCDLKNFAEVELNGRALPLLWKPPYRLDVTDALASGPNSLSIKVTNLWPNRLIGDEQLPEDREWDGKHLKAWPQWVLDGKPSPTGRFTFTTWHHWYKDDQPLPSGLFGPVVIRTVEQVPLR